MATDDVITEEHIQQIRQPMNEPPSHFPNGPTQYRQELINNLRQQVQIDFNAIENRYIGHLYNARAAYNATEHETRTGEYIRQLITERLITENMERIAMPHITGTTTTDTTLFTNVQTTPIHQPPIMDPEELNRLLREADAPDVPPMAPPTANDTESLIAQLYENTEAAVPANNTRPLRPFVIQQDTQAAELRTLRATYPDAVTGRDLQISANQALTEDRDTIFLMLKRINHVKAALFMKYEAPMKYRAAAQEIINNQFSSFQRRQISDLQNIRHHNIYQDAVTQIHRFREQRRTYVEEQERYGSQQARYHQQTAMIRQRPNVPKEINLQAIIDTVSQWENIWGVSVRNLEGNAIQICIGLCNIVMEESATETRYTYPAAIRLAPFYFTINLNATGQFVCRSGNRNAVGLSRNNSGRLEYDFHPHQLSDTPCFGTFGQSLIDMATHGDMISLINGIIAFYSQYNSQDSAGIAAMYYHPASEEFARPITPTDMVSSYISRFQEWRSHSVDADKLRKAIADYLTYFQEEQAVEAPTLANAMFCANCEENPVSDDDTYYTPEDGNGRVCASCWEERYCGDCEYHIDDCHCEPDNY